MTRCPRCYHQEGQPLGDWFVVDGSEWVHVARRVGADFEYAASVEKVKPLPLWRWLISKFWRVKS